MSQPVSGTQPETPPVAPALETWMPDLRVPLVCGGYLLGIVAALFAVRTSGFSDSLVSLLNTVIGVEGLIVLPVSLIFWISSRESASANAAANETKAKNNTANAPENDRHTQKTSFLELVRILGILTLIAGLLCLPGPYIEVRFWVALFAAIYLVFWNPAPASKVVP